MPASAEDQGSTAPADAGIARPVVPASADDRAVRRALLVAQVSLVLLGLVLVVIGAIPVAATLAGRALIDEARLASLWPAAVIAIGLAVMAEAVVLRGVAGRPAPLGAGAIASPLDARAVIPLHPTWPEAGVRMPPDVQEPPAAPTGEQVPGVDHARPTTEHATPEVERPAPDVRAALLELRALRRERLISRKQFKAKRRAIVAGMAPRFAGPVNGNGGTGGHGDGPSSRPLAYWGPTAE